MLAREIPLMLLVYGAAALFEIAGSFALWAVLRLGKPVWWIAPGIVALLRRPVTPRAGQSNTANLPTI